MNLAKKLYDFIFDWAFLFVFFLTIIITGFLYPLTLIYSRLTGIDRQCRQQESRFHRS